MVRIELFLSKFIESSCTVLSYNESLNGSQVEIFQRSYVICHLYRFRAGC